MAVGSRLAKLFSGIERLNSLQLGEVERLVASLAGTHTSAGEPIGGHDSLSRDWPHAPIHRLSGKGTFMVTAGTLNKEHHFCSAMRLDILVQQLMQKAKQYQWQIEAWAAFSNHYHFVGHALEDAKSLKPFLTHLHADTAREINRQDALSDRAVWFNFWETELTFEKSYLARLNYVHQNAVKHGLVALANLYRWCSAGWFERTASPAQVKTIYGFKTDRLNINDDYDVLAVD